MYINIEKCYMCICYKYNMLHINMNLHTADALSMRIIKYN